MAPLADEHINGCFNLSYLFQSAQKLAELVTSYLLAKKKRVNGWMNEWNNRLVKFRQCSVFIRPRRLYCGWKPLYTLSASADHIYLLKDLISDPFDGAKKKNKNTPNLTVKIHTGYTQLATPTDTLCTPLLTYSIFLFDFIYVAPCSLKGQSWEVNADTLLWLYLTLPLLYNDINGAIKWVAPIHREGGASGVHKTHRTPTERERERESFRQGAQLS